MVIGGGDVVATPLAALVAPEIPPLLMQRLPIAKSCSFSDSNRRLLLLLPLIPSASNSNLVISVAVAFYKNYVALACTKQSTI